MVARAYDERLRAWSEHGFFVVPRMFDAQQVQALAQACDHVLAQVRAASSSAGHTSTHITGLFAPEYFRDRPELQARLITLASSPSVLQLIGDLAPAQGQLNLRSAQYFHEPSARDYDGEWHRDGDEIQPLHGEHAGDPRGRPVSLRYRIALSHDDHLEIVPGSHRRSDTPQELRIRRERLRERTIAGAVRVVLEPGDVCVFDIWSIHRGRYRHGSARKTLDLVFRFGIQQRPFLQFLTALDGAKRKPSR